MYGYADKKYVSEEVLIVIDCNNIENVTERCGQTLCTSSTYHNKKNVHINMCPETFNLWVIADRVYL
jgi:hypothetical protein